jgi:hypothetical protein
VAKVVVSNDMGDDGGSWRQIMLGNNPGDDVGDDVGNGDNGSDNAGNKASEGDGRDASGEGRGGSWRKTR